MNASANANPESSETEGMCLKTEAEREFTPVFETPSPTLTTSTETPQSPRDDTEEAISPHFVDLPITSPAVTHFDTPQDPSSEASFYFHQRRYTRLPYHHLAMHDASQVCEQEEAGEEQLQGERQIMQGWWVKGETDEEEDDDVDEEEEEGEDDDENEEEEVEQPLSSLYPFCCLIRVLEEHIQTCRDGDICPMPNCTTLQEILIHLSECIDPDCPMCGPLKREDHKCMCRQASNDCDILPNSHPPN